MKIGSLFAGIGGLELGLEWAGVGETVWQVERDKYCQQVLAKHWPNATRYDDVCTVGAHNLEPVDVICGGFPCQDISYAGKGAGLAGHRSGLWYEFARIVGEMGPRYVVVENVAALLTRGIGDVLGTLADLGYDAEWSTLRASDVGAPHRRERVFLIAWLADARCEHGPQSHLRQEQSGQRAPRRGDDPRCGADVGHPHRGRREQPDAGERADAVAGARHDAMGDAEGERRTGRQNDADGRGRERAPGHPDANVEHAESRGRRTGAGLDVRRDERGCDGVGDADDQGPQGHGRPVGKCVSGRWDAAGRHGAASGAIVGWSDATPVRGADGTVRLIPAEAARWAESEVRSVVDGTARELVGRGQGEAINAHIGRESQEPSAQAGAETLPCPDSVRGLRRNGRTGAPSSGLFTTGADSSAVPRMSPQGRPEGRICAGEEAEGVQGLRGDVLAIAQQEERDMRPLVPVCARSPECSEALGGVLPERQSPEKSARSSGEFHPLWPVARGVKGRVAQLRAIGNAVVPQVAEVVGRRLLEIDAALRAERAA